MEELIEQIKSEGKLMVARGAARRIFKMVKSVEKLDGDIAEVGVFMGGTAKIICSATNKTVRLFDTFSGLPELSNKDSDMFHAEDYSASFDSVSEYLKAFPNLSFHIGLFPETTGGLINNKFAFVHLDVDLYKSTLDCLEFFYPRMVKGGFILSHDYPESAGVKKAFDEFFLNKPERIYQLTYEQCSVIKK